MKSVKGLGKGLSSTGQDWIRLDRSLGYSCLSTVNRRYPVGTMFVKIKMSTESLQGSSESSLALIYIASL